MQQSAHTDIAFFSLRFFRGDYGSTFKKVFKKVVDKLSDLSVGAAV
jgi:hypothetical protein